MSGGRVALLAMVLVVPLALAEGIVAADPARDEITITNLKTVQGQPEVVECHDTSIDVASVALERDATHVRATYRFYGALDAPAMVCNDEALPVTDRAWHLEIAANDLPFSGSTRSTSDAPAPPACIRANHGDFGNSVSCVGTVTLLSDGFRLEMPLAGTLLFQSGSTFTYTFGESVTARAAAESRATVGVSPLQRVLYGAYDWGDADLR